MPTDFTSIGRRRYSNNWGRLVANSEPEFDNEQACWHWKGRTWTSNGYPKLKLYVPGLGREVDMMAHILAWLIHQPHVGQTANELYLAYVELRCSGLEIDHGCVCPPCIRPDHLEPVTHSKNELLKHERRRAATLRNA